MNNWYLINVICIYIWQEHSSNNKRCRYNIAAGWANGLPHQNEDIKDSIDHFFYAKSNQTILRVSLSHQQLHQVIYCVIAYTLDARFTWSYSAAMNLVHISKPLGSHVSWNNNNGIYLRYLNDNVFWSSVRRRDLVWVTREPMVWK